MAEPPRRWHRYDKRTGPSVEPATSSPPEDVRLVGPVGVVSDDPRKAGKWRVYFAESTRELWAIRDR